MLKAKHITSLLLCFCVSVVLGQCGPSTPSFAVNMVGSPTGTYISPPVVRADTCCGSSAPDKCLLFSITLDPNAVGINFGIATGAVPPGALYYQIGCGPLIPVGSPICLSGAGPHILTFCKPGNNTNTYSISSIPAPSVPDSILVRSGCSGTLAVSGFSVPTINWTSVNPGPNGFYNGYLNCTSGCATVIATPTGTPPAFVDFEVSGFAASPCQANFYRDTVRVYFYNDLNAGINPVNPTICFGSTSAVLTVTASGGLPAYTYSWSTGATTQSISVGSGTYTAYVNDKTACPGTVTTMVVNQFTLPITANAGPDQTLCKSSPIATINGSITSASGGLWSGGGGVFSPSTSSLNINYTPTAAELSAGSVQLILASTGNAGCPPDQDTIKINFQNIPVVNAGPNVTVCANNNIVNLSGSITGFSSTPQWSTSGGGTFSSSTSLVTTYTPSAADISAGNINIFLTSANNGACPPAQDTVKVFFTPPPVANAAVDQTVCSNSTVTLNGNVAGATTTGNWTTSGDGSFNPGSTVLNGSYIPGPNDISNGVVTLILTTTGNGSCIAAKDTMKIFITKIAFVNAGPSQSICSNTGTVALAGTIGGGTSTGVWGTNGSGSFNPNNTTLNTTYFITVADVSAGQLTFTLNSTNNGACPQVTDTMKVTITQLAVVNAGPNQALCETTPTIGLAGSVAGVTGSGIWTGSGGGSFNPNNTALNTTYSISATDVSAGSVTFTLASTGNGNCPVVRDTVKITIRKRSFVNAGSDQSVCSTSTNISINGAISGGSSSGQWATTGSGNFSFGNSVLNNVYTISSGDISAGNILLILTSTNNGVCPANSDTLKLMINKLPVIKMSKDTTVCSYQNPFGVAANIIGGDGSVSWTTNGSGYFINPFFNPTQYSFGAGDIAAGNVTLTCTSTNNGACGNVSSTMHVVIRPAPTASFTASTYTANIPNDPIQFTNQSINANSYYWTFGDGGSTTLSDPSHNYQAVGFFYVSLIASNQYGCKDTLDQLITVISDIQFPNAFTPNTNGSNGGTYNINELNNDVFFPYTSGVTDYHLLIFNRFGEVIFESKNINVGWDGYYGGKLCQQDAYVWKANVKFFDGRSYQKTGSVTLLK